MTNSKSVYFVSLPPNLKQKNQKATRRMKLMSTGPAYTFIRLIASLVLGAVTWVTLSPIFTGINNAVVSIILSMPDMYPDNVVDALSLCFMFLEYIGIVMLIFESISFLKSYLQPWTRTY